MKMVNTIVLQQFQAGAHTYIPRTYKLVPLMYVCVRYLIFLDIQQLPGRWLISSTTHFRSSTPAYTQHVYKHIYMHSYIGTYAHRRYIYIYIYHQSQTYDKQPCVDVSKHICIYICVCMYIWLRVCLLGCLGLYFLSIYKPKWRNLVSF